MIVEAILALSLGFPPQEPCGKAVTVVSASAEVPAGFVGLVEREVRPALEALLPTFGMRAAEPFEVVVHASGEDLAPELSGLHHEGSPGFALLAHHQIHVLMREVARTGRGLRTVLMHEIAHELLDQACGANGHRIPRWFHEGIAQTVAGDTYLGVSEEMIVWRAATGNLLPFYEMEGRFPEGGLELSIAYAQSYSFVSWLTKQHGIPAVLDMARAVDAETTLDQAMVRATNKSTESLRESWKRHLLHGSGAAWRSVLSDFFPLSIIMLMPVLGVAVTRRLRADRLARQRLLQQEREEAETAPSQVAVERGAEAPTDQVN